MTHVNVGADSTDVMLFPVTYTIGKGKSNPSKECCCHFLSLCGRHYSEVTFTIVSKFVESFDQASKHVYGRSASFCVKMLVTDC